MRAWLAALLLGALAPLAGHAACRADQVELRGSAGVAHFTVELAQTQAQRNRGLMGRARLAPGAGMLFLYPRPQPVAFWMKDTLIPLDMIFLDGSGRVTRVHARAVPGDETPIDGGEAVQAVLEINGGLAAQLGIAPGTEMRYPAFDQSGAAWPCAAP